MFGLATQLEGALINFQNTKPNLLLFIFMVKKCVKVVNKVNCNALAD